MTLSRLVPGARTRWNRWTRPSGRLARYWLSHRNICATNLEKKCLDGPTATFFRFFVFILYPLRRSFISKKEKKKERRTLPIRPNEIEFRKKWVFGRFNEKRCRERRLTPSNVCCSGRCIYPGAKRLIENLVRVVRSWRSNFRPASTGPNCRKHAHPSSVADNKAIDFCARTHTEWLFWKKSAFSRSLYEFIYLCTHYLRGGVGLLTARECRGRGGGDAASKATAASNDRVVDPFACAYIYIIMALGPSKSIWKAQLLMVRFWFVVSRRLLQRERLRVLHIYIYMYGIHIIIMYTRANSADGTGWVFDYH